MIFCAMAPQQIGHVMSDTEHSLQLTRWPHGINTIQISLSIHILHCFSLCSLCSFFSGSSSEGEKERRGKKKRSKCVYPYSKSQWPKLCFVHQQHCLFTLWTNSTLLHCGSVTRWCIVKTVLNKCLQAGIVWACPADFLQGGPFYHTGFQTHFYGLLSHWRPQHLCTQEKTSGYKTVCSTELFQIVNCYTQSFHFL